MGHLMCAEQGIKHIGLNATHEWLRHLTDAVRNENNLVIFAPTAVGRTYRWISKMAQRWH